ncbi:MAG: hypothetical protein FJZ79_10340 [Chlorobi bacterium]|nr:hypothetical protein [Chlorobiota bacterium]
MVRQYVMLGVILSMIFFAVGCSPRKPDEPERQQEQLKKSDDLWKGYGDVDTTPKPKYHNMPPIKK